MDSLGRCPSAGLSAKASLDSFRKGVLLMEPKALSQEEPHDPGARSAIGRRAGLTGILCNLMLFAAKLAVGLISGSVSISADAVNNLSDASGSIVTFLGFRLAEKPADSEHPYGHARIEYLSGLAVAMFILLIGWELVKTSLDRILHPAPVDFSPAVVLVLAASILTKLWLCLYFRRMGKKIHSTVLAASAVDSRNDVIATAAVLLAGLLGRFTALNADGYVGLLVALFILWSGIGIARETIDPLLGKAPDPELGQGIIRELSAHPEVLGWHDLMLHDYGPGRCFGSVHVEMDMHRDPLAAHEVIDEIERACAARYGIGLSIHYDPIVTDDPEMNALRRAVLDCIRAIDPHLSAHDFRMVRGKEHSSLIFDLVVPYERKKEQASIGKAAENAVHRLAPNCSVIITLDDAAFNPIRSDEASSQEQE